MTELIRIDDRLIHGQIVSRWLHFSKAELIIVVDDESANDFMLKTILGLAVPSGVELEVVTKKHYVETEALHNPTKRTLMIIRDPKELLELIEMGYDIGEIPVVLGNMSPSTEKKNQQKILDYIYVDSVDSDYLKALASKIKNLRVQAVPDEKEKDILQLLERRNL